MTPATAPPRAAGALTHLGVFLLGLAILLQEMLLTRIFSVTMWYHFAFLAVAVAMFGLTVGALIVYLRPHAFPPEQAAAQLARYALGGAVTLLAGFWAHLQIPVSLVPSLVGLSTLAITYALVAVPFVLAGVAICVALTRYPLQVHTLYAADLAGAASGCLLLIGLLELCDAPTAVVIVALLVCTAATCFARAAQRRTLFAAALAGTVALAVLVAPALRDGEPVLALAWVKQRREAPALYERWNSFARIRVAGEPDRLAPPFGWGMSVAYAKRADPVASQLILGIDAHAGAIITGFAGDLSALDYLGYDLVNLVHHLRRDAAVFIVGVGGGRDVLSALAFGQRRVVAVEVNEDIIETVNGRFGDYTGHLDRYPQVHFVNDDARSYLARQNERFDIIQLTMADTWAATASGAFALTENSLYTVEAWELFLGRLAPHGLLTASRWYFGDQLGETHRLASLAAAALRRRGVARPRDHIAVVRNTADPQRATGVILVGNEPFSAADLDRLETIAQRLQFEIVLSPRNFLDATLADLTDGRDPDAVAATLRTNVAPPTDDAPFFFHMLRLRDLFDPSSMAGDRNAFNSSAVSVVGMVLLVVILASAACLWLPLRSARVPPPPARAWPLVAFFAAIGLGFMLVEVSLMQRLAIFLGHPTYSLAGVLFALLLAAGVGSYLRGRAGAAPARLRREMVILLVVLGASGLALPALSRAYAASTTPIRIAVALALVAPPGLFMGMALPGGMALAARQAAAWTPWLWAINGATSVCGSVLAVILALTWTISTSFWTGWLCYALAALALALGGVTAQKLITSASPPNDRGRESLGTRSPRPARAS